MNDKEKTKGSHDPLDYKEGSNDPDGMKIEVVYTRTDEYVIYHYGIYVALIVAGFSENFIPNILSNLSEKAKEKETETEMKEDTPISCKP